MLLSMDGNDISTRNRILLALPRAEVDNLLPRVERVWLRAADVLYDAEQPIEHVYFPETAVVSLLSVVDAGAAIETAMVGQEGLVGLPVFHHTSIPTEKALVQCDGFAVRMAASAFA